MAQLYPSPKYADSTPNYGSHCSASSLFYPAYALIEWQKHEHFSEGHDGCLPFLQAEAMNPSVGIFRAPSCVEALERLLAVGSIAGV
jgi:hypothetical protein